MSEEQRSGIDRRCGKDRRKAHAKVPVKTISNLKIADESSPLSTTMRRHGIQFEELTDDQTSKLGYFIQKHTTHEA